MKFLSSSHARARAPRWMNMVLGSPASRTDGRILPIGRVTRSSTRWCGEPDEPLDPESLQAPRMVATSRRGGAPARSSRVLGVSRQPLDDGRGAMDVLCTHGAGLAVHKQTVRACRVPPDPTGEQAAGILALKALGAMSVDQLALSDGLAAVGMTPVAMERSGAYWQPLSNILEGDLTVFLVNAAHVQQVPGRQTAKADARWLAKRMRDGVRRARCIPPVEQRDGRELTRYRTKLVQEPSREVNRVPGVLARANIQLAAGATASM